MRRILCANRLVNIDGVAAIVAENDTAEALPVNIGRIAVEPCSTPRMALRTLFFQQVLVHLPLGPGQIARRTRSCRRGIN